MIRIPSRFRAIMWGLMFIMACFLVWWEPQTAEKTTENVVVPSPSESVQTRTASEAELQMSIQALGQQQLAKRVYFIDGQQQFKGMLVWLQNGTQEQLAYLAGQGEHPTSAKFELMRAIMYNKIQLISLAGDGDLVQRIKASKIPPPANSIPENWTVLLRQ